MMNKYKIFVLIMLVSCLYGRALAQIPQERGILLNAGVGFGFSPLYYSEDKIGGQNFESENRSGMSFELGGTYFLNEQWGVATGIGISNNRTTATLKDYSASVSDLVDSDQLSYTLLVNGSKVSEKQSVLMFDIPITAQYRMNLKEGLVLEAGAGFKLGIPIKKSYSVEESNITTRAFYPDLNFTLTDHPESGMYENRTDWKPSGDLDAKVSLASLFEAGVLYSLNENMGVDIKAYFLYGLNKLNEGEDVYLMEAPEQYNSLSAQSGTMKNLSVGIKIGFVFDYSVLGL